MTATAAGRPDWVARFVYGLHDRRCSASCPRRDACAPRWSAHLAGIEAAVEHLQAKPRDASGARRIIHDHLCLGSYCTGAEADDHARRTLSDVVAALRKAVNHQ